uniref:Putative ovule protein n=1 Tax=Solanum chacoense TaxID=4108 RepID=A0A0V0GQP4_SOLCH
MKMRINPFSSSSFSFFMILSSSFWTIIIIITLYSFLKFHRMMMRVKWGRATETFNSFNIKTIIISRSYYYHLMMIYFWRNNCKIPSFLESLVVVAC